MNRFHVLATAGLLSACNGVIVEKYPELPSNYHVDDFEQATDKGAIVTIVVGDPFAGSAGNLRNQVRSLMRNQVGRFPVEFVSRQGAGTTAPFKMVVVFNPGPDVNDDAICRMEDRTPTTTDSSGRTTVAMIFCHDMTAKISTRGHVGGVVSRSDPRFASLIRQVAQSLIPLDVDIKFQRGIASEGTRDFTKSQLVQLLVVYQWRSGGWTVR